MQLNSQADSSTNVQIDSVGLEKEKNEEQIVINIDSLNTKDSIRTASIKKKAAMIHQFRFGIDIARIGFNFAFPSKQAYEFQADYFLKNKLYIAAETGFGSGTIDYENLKYNTNAFFIRLGVDKSFLDQLGPEDFDMGFLGARYGMGIGQRTEATYLIQSPFGTEIIGHVPSQTFTVHWFEVMAGIKVELWKGVFAGWTARGRFLLNPGTFKELSPNFIAGYGKGDKNSIFDFNFYLSYAIRWNKGKL